ncbi:hypothetical protein QTJ16_003492 [Diplocarpon rosae]|uniref:Uncharacterized protein n=1 Tax=Diplocarpon rosae TaxID=946125 RepID=A0AAD9WFN7_9HELO|nr:hypothetical protein QTJ16_003492 [Diplocarpon rosae]
MTIVNINYVIRYYPHIFSKVRWSSLGRLHELAIIRIHNEGVFDLRDEIAEFSNSEVITAYFQFFDGVFSFGNLEGSKRCLLQSDIKEREYLESMEFFSSTHEAKKIAPESRSTLSSSSNKAAANDIPDFEASCGICCGLCATPFMNSGDAGLGVVTTCGVSVEQATYGRTRQWLLRMLFLMYTSQICTYCWRG